MKKKLLLAGVGLLAATLIAGAVYASGAIKAAEKGKSAVTESIPVDYQQYAREYIVKKYGEQLDNLWIVNESSLSLPYSKVELWSCKIYFKNDSRANGNKNGYYVIINKADNTISEQLQPFLDEEEKAVQETCGKLDKAAYEKEKGLQEGETMDVEIVYINADTKPLQKELTELDVKIISVPENWQVVYATVTKKQLKEVESIKGVAEIRLFYGFPTEQ